MSDYNLGIVADWLVTFAGAEKVIAEFIKVYPDASLYSVVDFLNDESRQLFNGKHAETTFIQNLPKANKKYQTYLPLMPLAIEQLDVSSHDIILSSSHAVSKGVLTGPDQLHICYVHSPLRYAWDLQHQYLKSSGLDKGIKGMLAKFLLHKMRIWDVRTAHGVDHFIANSHFISRRIKKVYGRDSTVIYPPVDVNRFQYSEQKDDFYFTASRMVPYKRVDLIVDAFNKMPDKKLIVIGDGTEFEKVKRLAKDNIEILGYKDNNVMQDYMKRAKAFVFAAEEDFGITPVEAQACGTPVIAFGKGGALETIKTNQKNNSTGVLFHEQNTQSIIDAVSFFESNISKYSPYACRDNSLRFSEERFRNEIKVFVDEKWSVFNDLKRVVC